MQQRRFPSRSQLTSRTYGQRIEQHKLGKSWQAKLRKVRYQLPQFLEICSISLRLPSVRRSPLLRGTATPPATSLAAAIPSPSWRRLIASRFVLKVLNAILLSRFFADAPFHILRIQVLR